MKYYLSIFALVFLTLNSNLLALGEENIENKIINVNINKNTHVFKEFELVVTNVIFEEIEADPLDSASYPSGYRVTVYISVNSVTKHAELILFEMSAPYENKLSVDWNGYRINLLNVSDDKNPTIKLSIEQIK